MRREKLKQRQKNSPHKEIFDEKFLSGHVRLPKLGLREQKDCSVKVS